MNLNNRYAQLSLVGLLIAFSGAFIYTPVAALSMTVFSGFIKPKYFMIVIYLVAFNQIRNPMVLGWAATVIRFMSPFWPVSVVGVFVMAYIFIIVFASCFIDRFISKHVVLPRILSRMQPMGLKL